MNSSFLHVNKHRARLVRTGVLSLPPTGLKCLLSLGFPTMHEGSPMGGRGPLNSRQRIERREGFGAAGKEAKGTGLAAESCRDIPGSPSCSSVHSSWSFLAAREAGEMWSLHKAALPRNRAVHC